MLAQRLCNLHRGITRSQKHWENIPRVLASVHLRSPSSHQLLPLLHLHARMRLGRTDSANFVSNGCKRTKSAFRKGDELQRWWGWRRHCLAYHEWFRLSPCATRGRLHLKFPAQQEANKFRSSSHYEPNMEGRQTTSLFGWLIKTCFILSNSVSASLVLPIGLTLEEKALL